MLLPPPLAGEGWGGGSLLGQARPHAPSGLTHAKSDVSDLANMHAKSDVSDLANMNAEIGISGFRLAREPTSPASGAGDSGESAGTRESAALSDRASSSAAHHMAGRRTAKRAPSTTGRSSAPLATPSRFSARMRPPCASMICFEIDRPRPEFWPKP